MKKEKIPTILCFVAALLFYIAALIGCFTSSDTTTTVIRICLGSVFLCSGIVYKNKQNKEDKK